jgi:nicotinamidase-related amidase
MNLIPDRQALLVMDFQTPILGMLPGATELRNRMVPLLSFARNKQIPVIYVVVGFRPGLPEVSPRNKSFANSKARLQTASMDEWMKIDEALAPASGDIVVVKRRYSAFTGSDLEVVLRSLGIGHLVLAGVSTSGVVLSTVREAADKDYRMTVLADCCADGDDEVHHVLMTKLFPRQSEVISSSEWMNGIAE